MWAEKLILQSSSFDESKRQRFGITTWEENTSLAPSRNIIFIFYEAFFITTSQHTLYITHYGPQAAVLWCASCGLAAFPPVAQQHWQKHMQSRPVPVALRFVQGKHAANVAPRDTKVFYQVRNGKPSALGES